MANTVTISLTTDFNTSPYFDDFDESKNFYRILFNPGFAVQARELTQIQSILSKQIDYLTSHIFRDGSKVKGGEFKLDLGLPFVKIQDQNSLGNTVNVVNFSNTLLTGVTSGVKAIVVNTANGSEALAPDTKTLFVKYTSSGSSNSSQKTFILGEEFTSNNGFRATILSANTSLGFGSQFTLGSGIFYAKNHLINIPEQTILLDKYSTTPSYKVGLKFNEDIVTFSDDSTLLDPASGSFNENAPGAHRLKLAGVLTKVSLTNTNPTGFGEILRIKDGVTQEKAERPQYADIKDELARRMYNESGDYIVRGLTVRVREHLDDGTNIGYLTANNDGDSTKLAVGIEPGIGVVKGYDYENLITRYLAIDKATDVKEVEQLSIPANYGNYVSVDEVAGHWDINNGVKVSLYDTAQNKVSGLTYSSGSVTGAKIGEARIKALVYDSGTAGAAGAKYKAYLHDVQMSNGAFANTRAIYYNNASKADAYADIALVSGNAVMQETSFNKGVFSIPARAVRRIRDANNSIESTYEFIKTFDVTIAADGTFSVATGAADEIFPFSTGALNATQKNADFIVVLNAAASANLTGTAQFQSTTNTVNGFATAFNTELNVGDKIKVSTDTVRIVTITDANTVVVSPTPSINATGSVSKVYVAGEIIDMAGDGIDGARSITIASTTSATFDLNETLTSTVSATVQCTLSKNDAREVAKTYKPDRYVLIRTDTHASNTVGPWSLGLADVFDIVSIRKKSSAFSAVTDGIDVTDDFVLDNGQRDTFYDLARLRKKKSSGLVITSGDYLLVKLDYFTHDTSQGVGYLSVDSYPIDDGNPANTTAITTKEIPVFVSPVTGQSYDLRDSIDMRPIVTNTANDATTLGATSTNPSANTTMVVPSGGLHTSYPNEEFDADLSYYLKRKDLVVINDQGVYTTVRGVPSLFPVTPTVPENSMALGAIDLAPYPSLAPNVAKAAERGDLGCQVRQLTNRRYTMRDIGALAKRIDNLEYYTSLNALEKDTAELQIVDENGLDRFKNGILVDPFTGHNIGNIFDPDYVIAIDPKKQELRPTFNLHNIELEFANTSTGVYRAANDVVLKVTSSSGFTNTETVYQGTSLGTAVARGTLRYATSNRLYIEDTQGSFSNSLTIIGDSSGVNSAVTTVTTPNKGSLVSLPYNHTIFASQPYATTTRNCAGLFWNWKGILELDPSQDMWVDTVVQPSVQVNFDNNLAAWQNLADAWGTQWNDWQTVWTGSEVISTTTDTDTRRVTGGTETVTTTESTILTTQQQTRSGFQLQVIPETITQNLGAKVVDVSIVPWIRSRSIKFTCHGMKPSTKLYSFFDGEDVTAYITPTNSSYANTGSEGSDLTSGSDGRVYGLFRIPNEDSKRFPVGTKVFRISDSPTNSSVLGQVTTAAEAKYVAKGLIQKTQDTIVSTQEIDFQSADITETRIIEDLSTNISRGTSFNRDRSTNVINRRDFSSSGDSGEPLSQSFLVRINETSQPGIFLTKVDLFFATKHATLPIILTIREMRGSQIVSSKVVPYSRVIKYPTDVNVSDDATAPTPFVFPSPIYLQTGAEYALHIQPAANNPDYQLWIAQLGQSDILTSERVTKQPFAGILFASANDRTWSPIQDEDATFIMYRAEFDTDTTGQARLWNKASEYFSLSNVSSTFHVMGEGIHGEVRLTLAGLSGTANTGEKIVGVTSGAIGSITNINGSVYRLKDVSANTKFTTAENVFMRFANNVNTGASANISSQTVPFGSLIYYDSRTSNVKMHLEDANGTFVVGEWIKGQTNSHVAKLVSLDSLQLNTMDLEVQNLDFPETVILWKTKVTSNSNVLESSFSEVKQGDNTDFDNENAVLGESEENSLLSGNKSFQVQATLTSENARISPIIDLTRAHSIIVGNRINNDNTGEANTAGGNAQARYITRKVTLDDGQDAEDLRVLITAYRPASTNIEVYYKILHSEDSDTFTERSWVEMTLQDGTNIDSDTEKKDDFKEYEYNIPSAKLTGPNGEVQYINSVGVTFTGFKYFILKIVLLSPNTSLVPRLRDMRTIALQL